MKIIRPTTVTDSILLSTNILEDDHTAWSSLTTYDQGNRVILVSTHKIYEAMQGSNLNKNPPDYLTGTTPYWLEVGATNAWKMFDGGVSTLSTKSTSIIITLLSSMASAIALVNTSADLLVITVTDPTDGLVLSQTINLLSTANVIDGFTYCFEEFLYTKNVKIDLPPYSAAVISITLTGATVSVGEIVLGKLTSLGCTSFGAELGIVDYSVKSVDTYGNAIILERAYSNRGNYNVTMHNEYVELVATILAGLRVTPVVWIPTDADYIASPLLTYGFYKDFSIVIEYATMSVCSIQIEGLI